MHDDGTIERRAKKTLARTADFGLSALDAKGVDAERVGGSGMPRRAMSNRIIVAQALDRWCVERRSGGARPVLECTHRERAYRCTLSLCTGLVS
jgi:hypothetical protein